MDLIYKYLDRQRPSLNNSLSGRRFCTAHLFGHISCIFMSCLHCDEEKFSFRIGSISRQFSLRILHIVKCQISENLDKYLRNIFHSNDPCRDCLNLALFDSKDSAFWPPFCFDQNLYPTVPCARVRKLIFQVNFVNWDRESVCSHFSSLVSLDFVRFVMAITIAGEVTGNTLTGLFRRM